MRTDIPVVAMNDELYHYGVKGMKWGVRRTQRIAKKDAKKYARAKMYYGEGAGNRRKLIKARVNERSKDPVYKKAFDDAYSKQNMERHASAAKIERRTRDSKKFVKRYGAAAITAGTFAYRIAQRTGADKVIAKHAKTAYSSIKNLPKTIRAKRTVKNLWKETQRRYD